MDAISSHIIVWDTLTHVITPLGEYGGVLQKHYFLQQRETGNLGNE